MKQAFKRMLVLTLAFLIVIGNLSTFAYADQSTSETDPSFVTEGTFQFTSNENKNIQVTNNYTFREDCFMRSSFDGCCHLAVLSSELAIASTSRFGDSEDVYEVQTENNSINLRNMLESMGFQDVSNNTYYDNRQLENSAGVVVGHMPIKEKGKDYTLLAIVPRSAGYKQEWTGNFTVEDDDIHYGFKAARDESLRYVKQYINEHGIEGDIKVWTAGHSRGAATANMLGAFFAGGGIEYFDGKVSITPEDVYCYAYATPKTIKAGLSKNTELSVSGSRGTPYDNDTPGEAFSYTGGGTVDPSDSIYGGIRNFIYPSDVITMVPPERWGYTLYGDVTTFGEDDCVTIDSLMQELPDVSTFAYQSFILSGNPELFGWYTFDLRKLDIVESEAKHDHNNMHDFLNERMAGLTYNAPTSSDYVSGGYQETLKAIAGLYGMLLMYTHVDEDNEIKLPEGSTKALLFMVLAHAAERLQAEGTASNETEAATIALCSLIEHFTGEEINPDDTADDLLKTIAKFIADNRDEPVAETASKALAETIEGALEDQDPLIQTLALTLLAGYHPDYTTGKDPSEIPLDEAVKAFIIACYEGPDPNTMAYGYGYTDASTRGLIFTILQMLVPEAPVSQTDKVREAAVAILTLLMTVTDDEGSTTTYSSFAEAADTELLNVLTPLLADAVQDTATRFGIDYYNDVVRHLTALTTNIDHARRIISYLLLYNDGEDFDVGSAVENAVTFYKNVGIIPVSHYNEIYIAWMKALANSDCSNDCNHYIKLVEGKKETCEEDGVLEHWIYHDKSTDKNYDDKYLTNELSDKDIVIPKTGHDWGEWTVVKEPTTKEEGLKRRICKHDKTHVEEETIDKLPEEPVVPDEPADPDKPDDPVKPDTPVKPETPEKAPDVPAKPADKKTAPRSGDSAQIFTWGLLMTISLIGVIIGIKKKI